MLAEFLPEQIEYAQYEIVFTRIFLALIIWFYVFRGNLSGQRLTQPSGFAHFLDLQFLSNRRIEQATRWIGIILLTLYAAGFGLAVTTSAIFLLCALRGSFKNSQGVINHRRQVLALVLMVQSVFYLWSWLATLGQVQTISQSSVIFWSQQALIAVYVVAALTKLNKSGLGWITRSHLIALQLVKSSEQKFHNTLQTSHRDYTLNLAQWILAYPRVAQACLLSGLVFELITPVMLYGRELALVGGFLLIAFHQFLRRTLHVQFPELEWTVIIFLINVPYWWSKFVMN